MRTVLMIGGTGCISTGVAQECLKEGMIITMINRGHKSHLIPKEVELIKADKDDKDTIKKALGHKRFDVVIDFLCYDKRELEESLNFYAAYSNQYVFISSCAVYDSRKTTVADENSLQGDERWHYSMSKMHAEKFLVERSKELNVNYTIVRPNVTYGDTRIPYGITPQYGKHGTLIQRILHGKPIITWSNGETRSNMMRVEDFSRAFVKLLCNPKAYNEAFNICSEKDYSFNEVLDIIEHKLGKKIVRFDITAEEYANHLPERAEEIIVGRNSRTRSSMAKFNKLFPEFKEQFDLKSGIEKTVDAYFEQNWMDGMDYRFDGTTDRILHEIIDKQKLSTKEYNLLFIDYLKENNSKQFKIYKSALNQNKLRNRLLFFCKRLARRILNRVLSN